MFSTGQCCFIKKTIFKTNIDHWFSEIILYPIGENSLDEWNKSVEIFHLNHIEKKRKRKFLWRMATLNHAKTTAWEAASETMRNKRPPGADISFSISPTSLSFLFHPFLVWTLNSVAFLSAYFSPVIFSTWHIYHFLNDPRNRTQFFFFLVRLWFTSLDAKITSQETRW